MATSAENLRQNQSFWHLKLFCHVLWNREEKLTGTAKFSYNAQQHSLVTKEFPIKANITYRKEKPPNVSEGWQSKTKPPCWSRGVCFKKNLTQTGGLVQLAASSQFSPIGGGGGGCFLDRFFFLPSGVFPGGFNTQALQWDQKKEFSWKVCF